MTILTELANHIVNFELIDSNKLLTFKTIDIILKRRKNSKTESRVIVIDGKEVPSTFRNNYVTYKCRCGRENKILVKKYLQKEKIVCRHCIQDSSFEEHLVANSLTNKHSIYEPKIHILNKDLSFEEMSEQFKKEYFASHLTNEEFRNYVNVFYKINDKIIENYMNQIKYEYIMPTNNQFRFCPKISFDNGITFESIKKTELICKCCKNPFKIHIYNMRNKNVSNLLCKKCGLFNHRYEIRLHKSGLTYQSASELYFIESCLRNNIKIENGLEIPYLFNGKMRTYISDFFLPEEKIIIEIKGQNQYYRNDLKTGKLAAKENAAIEFGKSVGISYKLLFLENIDEFIDKITVKYKKQN